MTPINLGFETATGEIASFQGKTTLKFKVGKHVYEQEFLLADIANDGIIGYDFLSTNKCNILTSRKCLSMKGEIIQFSEIKEKVTCYRITVAEKVVIPPETEMIVPGKVSGTHGENATGVLEGRPEFIEKSGLVVARSVIDMSGKNVPIRVANFHKESRTMYANTFVAMCEPAEISQIQQVNYVSSRACGTEDTNKSQEISDVLQELKDASEKNLNQTQRSKLKCFLLEHEKLFSKSEADVGHTDLIQHSIDTGDHQPIKLPPYRIPLSKRIAAENEIKSMANRGIIEPSSSSWSSPIIMVTKPDGSIRFCCDYRKLNNITKKDSQPLPRIDDTLDALLGAKWFSTLDLKSGFWQVGVDNKDRPKTSFSIQGSGLWKFKVMPFGLCNSPATFERLMERVLSNLTWKKCLVYLDDIIVFSKTFDEHIEIERSISEVDSGKFETKSCQVHTVTTRSNIFRSCHQ